MAVFHRQRSRLTILPSCHSSESKGKRRYRTRSRRLLVLAVVVSIATIGLAHFYLVEQYAWVRRRCLKSWLIWWDTVAAVECVEARTHKKAEQDPSLWDQNLLRNVQFAVSPVQHVHYTVTTPLFGQVLTLALCSMEAISIFCRTKGCMVHVWIVDQAAATLKSDKHASWLDEMQATLQDSRHCLHISAIGDTSETDQLLGSACVPSVCTESSRELRNWLSTRLASEQLPAHVSDAWRLVALSEYGGLYLDADVLPLLPNILHLPSPTVPAQSKIGAYRLNGGVLALDLIVPCENEPLSPVGGVHRTPTSFLEAMIEDHLIWAPRLVRLPSSQQTFGFLGPCALTRVYLARRYEKPVTVLHVDRVEGAINEASLCHDDSRLSVHFSGKRKNDWYGLLAGHSCMRSRVHDACPRVLENHGLFA